MLLQNTSQAAVRFALTLALGSGVYGSAIAQTPTITNVSPVTNSHTAALNSDIEISFSTAMDVATLTAANIRIYGSQTGFLSTNGNFSGATPRVFNPAENFKPNELISVTVTGASSTSGTPINPYRNIQFRAAAQGGSGAFNTSTFGSGDSGGIALGDLDGDGDLDAICANGRYDQYLPEQIWLNNGDGSFTLSSFGGGRSGDVALGDLDGDGDLDAIITNWDQPNHIWINNGDATFTTSALGGGRNFEIKMGDLDGDGDLDAVIGRWSGQFPQLWLNNGDATFAVSTFGLNSFTIGLDIGDLDGDGDLDLLLTNFGISVIYMNNGDATFAPIVTSAFRAISTVFGDLDNDGDLDMVVFSEVDISNLANFKPFPNQLFLNNGDGTFVTSTFAAGVAYDAKVGDIDGDGDLDIVTADTWVGGQRVFVNNGDATFTLRTFGHSAAYGVDLGDLDGDGDLDAVFARGFFGVAAINEFWLNQDELALTSSVPTAHAPAAPRNSNIELTFNAAMNSAGLQTDPAPTNANLVVYGMQTGQRTPTAGISFINGNATVVIDLAADLLPGEKAQVIVTGATAQIGVTATRATVLGFRAAVDGGTAVFTSSTLGAGASADVALGDLDLDGDLDAIVANGADQPQDVWLNNGDATFTVATFGSATSASIAIGDLDGDGDPDAIIANEGGGAQEVWLNNSDGTFASSGFGGGDSRAVAIGDLDGNGALDAVIANFNAPQEIWLNNGDGTFSSSSFGSGASTAVAIGDLDNDGALDVIVGNDNQPREHWLNNGGGVFTSSGFGGGATRGIALGDLDNDGNLDAVIVATTSNTILLGNGDGSFASSAFGSGDTRDVALGDLDGDGALDAVLANDAGEAQEVWLNNGDGTFTSSTLSAGNTRGVALGDLDGTGDLDILLAVDAAPQEIWLNLPPAPTVTALTPNTTTASLNGMSIDVSGADFEATSASITTLDAQGVTSGTLQLTPFAAGSAGFSALIPAGLVATAGTLTLSVTNPAGVTTTTLSVLNDAPTIAVTNTLATSPEDVATTLTFSVSDVSPGIGGLSITSPPADLTTIASIVQVGVTGATTSFLVTPATNANGSVPLTFSVSDGDLTGSTSITMTFLPVNDPPAVSVTNAVATTDEDTATTAIVQLMDIDTPFSRLILTATSNNQSVVTNGGITLGATGATTTLFFDPAPDANGQALVTVTVDDAGLTHSTAFTLTVFPVNDAPIVAVTNAMVTSDEDIATTATVNLVDIDTPFNQLILSATSGNQSVVSDGGLSFGATGATTTLFIDPVMNATGSAPITVSVDDGEFIRTTTMTLTVNPVNDAPVVAVTNAIVTSDEDLATSTTILLGDVETPFDQLLLSATSNNQSLLLNSGITFGATGATTTVFLDPVADAYGQSQVTITVDDGAATNSTTFTLTVNPVNDPPTLTSPGDQTLPQNSASTAGFTIDDIDSPVGGLVVTATSNNQTLLPDSGLSLSAVSTSMQLTVAPACGQNGTAMVALAVSDGEFTVSTGLSVTVQPVTFSSIAGDVCGCPDTVMTYSVNPFGAGITGVWSIVGGRIISGQNTNAVEVIWDQGGAQSISIDRTSAAGCTTATSLAMTAKSLEAVLDYATTDGPAVTLDLLANDTGDGIGIASISTPSGGSLVDHNDGTITYTPDPGFGGLENIVYVIEDASSCRIDGTAQIAVTSSEEFSINLEFEEVQKDGVGRVHGLNQATSVAVSPDGRHLYATGQGASSVAIFAIESSNGMLSFVGREYHGHNGVADMQLAGSVIVSPDGANVYVAAYGGDAVVVFDRNSTSGTLSFVESKKNGQPDNGMTIAGLNGAISAAVSPDGKHVYVAGYSDNSVAIFSRDATGRLIYEGQVEDGSGGVDGLSRAISVTVSPDGKHVYAAGNRDNAVAVFTRNQATGALTFVEAIKDGSGGIDGLRRVTSVAVSPDGKHVYATGSRDRAVVAFSRNMSTGELTYIHRLKDGSGGVDGLEGAFAVTVSPDGRSVYVVGESDNAIAAFNRNGTTGELSYVECKRDGADGVEGLNRARSIAVTPDSRYVYGAGFLDHAVCVFQRNLAPQRVESEVTNSKENE